MILSGRINRGAGVIIPSFTFVAVANAVINSGLYPVFADISSTTMNIDTDNIIINLPFPVQAIIPVHTFGVPCDMGSIAQFAGKHGLVIIEDCAEALGSTYAGYKVGSLADCAMFSFTPTKNITTGEGGMITTNNAEIAEIVRTIREHGMLPNTRNAVVHGHNYRMPNILAAIGLVQLSKIDDLNDDRNRNSALLSSIPVLLPEQCSNRTYQMYTVQLTDMAGRSATLSERDRVLSECIDRGIDAKVYFYPPIHMQVCYIPMNFRCSTTSMAVTESVAARVISLPMYPNLSDEEIDCMAASFANSVKEVLG
jgi:dTDP-4-amino-4,6-dideoxygalactose transaminase